MPGFPIVCYIKNTILSLAWWLLPVILALGRPRLEGCQEFKSAWTTAWGRCLRPRGEWRGWGREQNLVALMGFHSVPPVSNLLSTHVHSFPVSVPGPQLPPIVSRLALPALISLIHSSVSKGPSQTLPLPDCSIRLGSSFYFSGGRCLILLYVMVFALYPSVSAPAPLFLR